MKKSRSGDIAVLGVFIALIIVLQAIAEVIQLFGMAISLALGLIPVLVLAQIKGAKMGALGGLAFGLTSLVIAVIRAAAVPMFAIAINPLVSVFPRVMSGLIAGLVYSAMSRRCQSAARGGLNSAVSALSGVLTNTVLFLSMFLAFAFGRTYGPTTVNFSWLLGAIVAVNTVVEAAAYVAIVPAIVFALQKAQIKLAEAKMDAAIPAENENSEAESSPELEEKSGE
ncbi:MAG: hypothetical protein ACOYIN_04640 [Christensenellales bacterium]|jgi:uncharacterized membrane protein|nr:ECF transporter S component [Eubacteriales bacterium]